MNKSMRTTIAAVALACGLAGGVPRLAQAEDTGMQRFQWQNRPLVVFAPERDAPQLARQLAEASRHAEGFAERDMVVVAVFGDRRVTVDGTPEKDLANAALRRRYRVSADTFAAILVGKDGTEKLRRDRAIGADTLFEIIDVMPMRRDCAAD